MARQSVPLALAASCRDLFLSQAAVRSHMAASSASQPTWASGKSKLMSGPVTSWQERGAALDPRWTSLSDTSQKVLHVANIFPSAYIHRTIHSYH